MSGLNETNAHRIPEVDRLIHEPARYNIMALLYVVERAEFLFVQNQTHLTPGNLSAHVGKLEAAKYLSVEKKFIRRKPKTFLKLTRLGRRAFEDYRTNMRNLFAGPISIEGKPPAEDDRS